jgi:hypothetical protein
MFEMQPLGRARQQGGSILGYIIIQQHQSSVASDTWLSRVGSTSCTAELKLGALLAATNKC